MSLILTIPNGTITHIITVMQDFLISNVGHNPQKGPSAGDYERI